MVFSECRCPCLHGLAVARSDSVIGRLSRVLPFSPAKLHGVASNRETRPRHDEMSRTGNPRCSLKPRQKRNQKWALPVRLAFLCPSIRSLPCTLLLLWTSCSRSSSSCSSLSSSCRSVWARGWTTCLFVQRERIVAANLHRIELSLRNTLSDTLGYESASATGFIGNEILKV